MDINLNLSEAEIIRDIRKYTQLSQRDFAKYFEIPVRTLQDWEQGKRTPPRYLITMMLRILRAEKNTKLNETSYLRR